MKISDIEVSYVGHYGTDLTVVNAARVSFNKESEWIEHHGDAEVIVSTEELMYPVLKSSDARLITYLAKHKHFSPFNHSFISVRVKAPIFVARQLVKHKFMPWNEVSRRYVDDEPEFYIPNDYRAKAKNVKQGSSEELITGLMYLFNDANGDCHGDPKDAVEYSTQISLEIYQSLLDKGVCAEQARMVLPQNMHTEWIWSGTLNAFCDMLKLRLEKHSQYESRIVANKVAKEIKTLFPVSFNALVGDLYVDNGTP